MSTDYYTQAFNLGYGQGLRDQLPQVRQLRQAVRDLTASSEKLRALNQAVTQKALKQAQQMKNMGDGINSYYEQTLRLERQNKALNIEYINRVKELRTAWTEISRLNRDRGFTAQDQQRLRTIIHSAAEIIHGGPVESVSLNPA